MISLPKEKIKPAFDINAVTMLLFGPPKIGKSTFCSRFEDALFLATEPGLNYLETFNVRINNWVRRFVPTIPARARSIVMPLVDVIGFAAVEISINPNGERVERRVLHTRAGTLWEAGDRTVRLPEAMPFKFSVFKQALEGEKNERN